MQRLLHLLNLVELLYFCHFRAPPSQGHTSSSFFPTWNGYKVRHSRSITQANITEKEASRLCYNKPKSWINGRHSQDRRNAINSSIS